MPDDLAACRDRALLLLGYPARFGALSSSRWTSSTYGFESGALLVHCGGEERSVQERVRALCGAAAQAGMCGIAALERRLEALGAAWPLFRPFDFRGQLTRTLDPRDDGLILRRRAAAAGVAGDFAGHSMRRGLRSEGSRSY